MQIDTRAEPADYGSFANPGIQTDTEVWTVGDVQTLKFNPVFKYYSLTLQQENIAANYVIFQTRMPNPPRELDWAVQAYPGMDIRVSDRFFFWVFNISGDDEPNKFTSPVFRIRYPDDTTTVTPGGPSPTSKLKSDSTGDSAQSSSSSSTTSGAVTQSSERNSKMTNIVIGLGVAFGLLLLLGVVTAGLFFWKRRKRARQAAEQAAAPMMQTMTYNELYGQDGLGQQLGLPVEMEHEDQTTRQPAELGSQARV